MKAIKNMGFGARKSRSGFTLIELLIVMVIIAILAGVVVLAVGGVFGTAKDAAYMTVHEDLQNAVLSYSSDHQGSYPLGAVVGAGGDVYTKNNVAINGTGLYYLDMGAIVNSGNMREVPDGCWTDGADDNDDNCDQTTIQGCVTTSHYLWFINGTTGSIYSACNGSLCINGSGSVRNNQDGYMTIWP